MATEENTEALAHRPGRPVLLAIVLTSLFWVVVGGLALLTWRRPTPVAFELQPPPATSTPAPTATPAPLAVDVAGAVSRPGVVRLPPGARVEDAIAAAGGLATKADASELSLARLVQDGEKLIVPAIPSPTATRLPGATPDPIGTESVTDIATPGSVVHINTATLEELDTLPGVGPKTAQAILDYRSANGPFLSAEALLAVKGIGESTLARLRDLIVVD
jgi:competence protein ComEA